jgi:hypothetical protein
MKAKYKALLFTVIAILLASSIYSGLQSMVERHEKVHQKIFEAFGVKSKIEIGFLEGTTEPKFDGYETPESLRIIRSLTVMNELVSYQFMTFYLLIAPMIAGIFIIMLILILKITK